MFSKALSIGFLALALVACSGEGERSSTPIVVHKSGADCLSEIGDNLAKFVEGKMSNAQVAAFWDCTVHAVSEYERLTAGEDQADRYRPENILRFLERHFMEGVHVNHDLLHSLMELKRVLLAGKVDEVTREELHQLIEFIRIIRDVSQDLNPHTKVLFLQNEFATDAEILAASEALKLGLRQVANWLDQRRQSYSFAQLETLIDQLDEMARSQFERKDIFESWRRGIAILPPIKAILLAGWKQGIDGHEWAPLFESMGDAYLAFLSIHYAFREDLNTALAREILPHGVLALGRGLKLGAKHHREDRIPIEEWRELFTALEKSQWLSEPFSSEALLKATRWMIERLLGNGQASDFMTVAHIDSLSEQMENWILLRRQAVSHHTGGARTAPKFEDALKASAPLSWDAEGRMYFADQPEEQWSSDARVRMVWPFALLNWIKEAYVGRDVDELNGDQMIEAVGEILPVLQGFGWLPTTSSTIGSKLLRESDLFTLSSNGDGVLQLHEGARYLAFVASAYRAADLWLQKSESVCGQIQDAHCVRAYGADLRHGIFSAMPRLMAVFSRLSAADLIVYLKSAEETVLDAPVEGEFGTSDLMQTYIIFQYIETFVSRFDTDHSEYVNLEESEAAFNHFAAILETLLSSSGLPEEELRAFFTFLMKYGDTPFTMFGGNVLWLNWKWHQNEWAYESGRPTLMGILKQLSKL